jgi:hypothetical protein
MSAVLSRPRATTPPRVPALKFWRWSPGTACLVAGIAGAAMAVLAPLASFGAVGSLVTRGDAARTASDIAGSAPLFLTGIVTLFIVTLLDLVITGALYTLFRSVSRRLSLAAAVLRIVFVGVFMVAIAQLLYALTHVNDAQAALHAALAYSTIWVTGLGIFGLHLVLTGYLAFRSGFVPRILGVLLAIAGVGYLADALALQLVPGFTPLFGALLFVGEPAMVLWELIRGRRLPRLATLPAV